MNSDKTNLLREVLSLRNYSIKTIETYIKSVNCHLQFSGLQKPTQESLYKFSIHLNDKNLSYSHIKNSTMAVKLYSEIVFGTKLNSNFLQGYRKERKLPDVLSLEEILFFVIVQIILFIYIKYLQMD